MTIRPFPPSKENGSLKLQAMLTDDSGQTRTLWYKVPESLESAVTSHADPFVVGALFLAMRLGEPVHVEGTVSPSLLCNLDRYMAAWSQWRPDKYRRVEITAREEREPQKPATDGVVMAFSGGIDSSYTAWSHANQRAGRQQVNLTAAVFVLGFDIPLECEYTDYANYFERARVMTDSIGIDLIPVSTNFRELDDWWEHCYAAGVASVIHLFKSFYRGGMLAGDYFQYHLDTKDILVGTSVFTDGWLGSDAFPIQHDGADKSRIEKVITLSEWPEALKHIRVCWQGLEKDRNCCRCQKCIQSILYFRCSGITESECFPLPLKDEDIATIRYQKNIYRVFSREIIDLARERGIQDPWVDALEDSLKPPTNVEKEMNATPSSQPGDGKGFQWDFLANLRRYLTRT